MWRKTKKAAASLGDQIAIPRWILIVLVVGVVLLVVFIWSRMREKPIHLRVDGRGGLQQMVPSIAGLTHGALVAGNRIEIFQNGAFFDGVLADIAAARESIHFETFVWWEGEVCARVARALANKARTGVQVRLLLDASGAKKIDEGLLEEMKRAGVVVGWFHPFNIANFGRINNRDHRKIVVIDGRIGWTGGHGIAQEWTGNAQDKDHYRDTFVRVQGPVVGQLQAAFSENWIETTGDVPIGDIYFPKLAPAGPSLGHVAFSSPSGSVSSVELLQYLAITSAQREIIIQNPYFIPDKDAVTALVKARKRGVRISIMLPSVATTDNAIVQHASHQLFEPLLAAGIRIFEYNKTLLHQKVMVVDEQWSTVGSTNFDARSFELNDEVSLGIVDASVARQLKQAYLLDLKSATEVTSDLWKKRSRTHRIQDRMAYMVNEQL